MGRLRKPKLKVFGIAKFMQRSAFPVGALVFLFVQNIYAALVVFAAVFISGIALKALYRQARYKRYLSSGLNTVDRMNGVEFEEFLLVHFRALNYKAQTTPVRDDYGADLVLEKDGIKTVVQAKRWGHKVGVEAVQQVLGAMGYYKAQKGIVVTNNYCSENAHVLAAANGIEIWNRDALQDMMLKNNGKGYAEHIKGKEIKNSKICLVCAAPLVIRSGKHGSFLGCSSFPVCSYTQNFSTPIFK